MREDETTEAVDNDIDLDTTDEGEGAESDMQEPGPDETQAEAEMKQPGEPQKKAVPKPPMKFAQVDRTKTAKAIARPSIEEIKRSDIENGILFLDNWEKFLLEVECELRKMVRIIGDKDNPTEIPVMSVIKVFKSRRADKGIKKALLTIGTALGIYAATKRELVAGLKDSAADLFPQDEFEVNTVTGEIIWLKGISSDEDED